MDKIAVLDFGGQYAHLIANRIRRMGVYSEIFDGATEVKNLLDYKGLILSGGPASVSATDSVKCDPGIFEMGIPILGICYGHQLAALLKAGDHDGFQVCTGGIDGRGVTSGTGTQDKQAGVLD